MTAIIRVAAQFTIPFVTLLFFFALFKEKLGVFGRAKPAQTPPILHQLRKSYVFNDGLELLWITTTGL